MKKHKNSRSKKCRRKAENFSTKDAVEIDIAEDEKAPLLTPLLLITFPKLHSHKHVTDPVALAHFYVPGTVWHWYPVEFDGCNKFFGLIVACVRGVGPFLLSELELITGPHGEHVKRDPNFKPVPLSKIK